MEAALLRVDILDEVGLQISGHGHGMTAQRAQYHVINQRTLKYMGILNMIYGMFLISALMGPLALRSSDLRTRMATVEANFQVRPLSLSMPSLRGTGDCTIIPRACTDCDQNTNRAAWTCEGIRRKVSYAGKNLLLCHPSRAIWLLAKAFLNTLQNPQAAHASTANSICLGLLDSKQNGETLGSRIPGL